MTFGIGSPGFNPFYCPPCPGDMVCNTICIDPIDGTLLAAGMLAVVVTGHVVSAIWVDE